MKQATQKELEQAEKQASKIYSKFTDDGTQIHGGWLSEYQKALEQLKKRGAK